MMNQEEALDQKREEIQGLLEEWAKENSILVPGEQIVFSLRIERVSTVRQEEKDREEKNPSMMPIISFFTNARARYAGVANSGFSIPACLNLLRRGRVGRVVDLLELTEPLRGLGEKRLAVIQKMLETAELSLSDELLAVINASQRAGNPTFIPNMIEQIPLSVPVGPMLIEDFFTLERAQKAGIKVRAQELANVRWYLQYKGWPKIPQGIRFRTMGEILRCSLEEMNSILRGPVTTALFYAMLESAGLRLSDR